MNDQVYDYAIVGGGFFGSILASHLARNGARVLLCERGPDLLLRASLVNQARVHNGYHYPRSILTALRSRVNFPRFVAEYRECIDSSFESYYAVARRHSKVTSSQFAIFMKRIGAPIDVAPDGIRKMFDASHIEDVFRVTEYAFDAVRLRQHCWTRLHAAGVDVWLDSRVQSVRTDEGALRLAIARGPAETSVRARRVLNCAYSDINGLLRGSNLRPLRLKHELTELCLITMPEPLRNMAVTVMCGPFFSVVPFPSRQLHTLSHVRYTPHCWWHDDEHTTRGAYEYFQQAPRCSQFPHMIRDASRYLPALRDARQVDSLWEVKTILPRSEVDDGRPILMFNHPDLPGLTSIMGAKIDNIYDAISECDGAGPEGGTNAEGGPVSLCGSAAPR